MKITHVAEIVKLSHVAEIVKLTHVARILEAGSMYDHENYQKNQNFFRTLLILNFSIMSISQIQTMIMRARIKTM